MKPCDKNFLDENLEEIADEIGKGMNRERVFTSATMPLCPDERIGKGNYSKSEMGLNKYEVIEQASDSGINQNDISKAIGKASSDKPISPMFERASKVFSDLFYDYLLFRKKIGIPKEVIKIGQLTGARLTDIVKLINPGGLVFLKDGTYNLTAAIDMLSNVSLYGAGWGATIIDLGATDDYGIEANTKSQCTLRDFEIKSNTGGAIVKNLIHMHGSDKIYVEHIFVNGCDYSGISVGGCTESWICYCYVYNPDINGIGLAAASHRSHCIGNTIKEAGLSAITTGGTILNISHNIVRVAAVDHGIHAAGMVASVITGNIIDDIHNDGILLDGTSNNNLVVGNRIRSWTNECIDDDGANNLINNNSCIA